MKHFTITLSLLLLTLFSNAQNIHYVLDTADSGPGTLRAAINAAYPGDTIKFNWILTRNGPARIKLASPLSITKSLSIVGLKTPGDSIIIDGGDSIPAFQVSLGSSSFPSFNLHNLTIEHCASSTNGGAANLDVAGFCELRDCVFRDNETSGDHGGAIHSKCMFLIIDGCVFTRNQITNCLTNQTKTGGALYTDSTSYLIYNSTFKSNSSCGSAGAMDLAYSQGPVFESKFIQNHSDTGTMGNGGAITTNSLMEIYFSDFIENTASNNGGAISINSTWATLKLNACHFENNSANLGHGGAIDFTGDSLIVNRSSFVNNTLTSPTSGGEGSAINFGSANTLISTSTFHNNELPSIVGGDAALGGTLTFLNSTLVNNASSGLCFSTHLCSSNYIKGSIVYGPGTLFGANSTISSGGYNLFSDQPAYSTSTDQSGVTLGALDLSPLESPFYLNTKVLIPSITSVAYESGDLSDISDAQNTPAFGIREIGAAEYPVLRFDTVTTCSSYNYWDSTFTHSGDFGGVRYNSMGTMDSLALLHLTIKSIDTTIAFTATGLIANEHSPGTTYQWVDCSSGFNPIPGETDSILPLPFNSAQGHSGTYAVILSANNCIDTTHCMYYSTISMEETNGNPVSIYPIPASHVLNIDFQGKMEGLKLVDLYGRSVAQLNPNERSHSVAHLPSGVYVLIITSNNNMEIRQKVIVE